MVIYTQIEEFFQHKRPWQELRHFAQVLFAYGADVNAIDVEKRWTLLHGTAQLRASVYWGMLIKEHNSLLIAKLIAKEI
jgi:hypothetical protein